MTTSATKIGSTQEAYKLGGRRSVRLVGVPWTTLCYKSRKKPQEALRRRLREIATTHVRYGYRSLTVLLKREGWKINAKRVHRLYDEENLKVRSVERKKIARRQRVPQVLYWAAYGRCQLKGDRAPAARSIQELVQVWKEVRKLSR